MIPAPSAAPEPLLVVEDLRVTFDTVTGPLRAVRGVSFEVRPGETLGILGESGSGKSVTMQAVMRQVPQPPGRTSAKRLRFRDHDLLTADRRTVRNIRGEGIAMIFQDALTSLNPSLTVGYQIGEMYRVRRGASRKEARELAIELMDRVGIPSAAKRIRDYPHQFSGGMRQRVMIATALALDPEILIADEPTTALDVTVQSQIMELLAELKEESGMAVVLITHDLGVISEAADRVLVMYAGEIVETGAMENLLDAPGHPYTRGLIGSIPSVAGGQARLLPIPGSPPVPTSIPAGCPFEPRCRWRRDRCTVEAPRLRAVEGFEDRFSACHFAMEVLDEPRG